MSPRQLWKGHGTENDFILIPDLDGSRPLGAAEVRALCDRHAGIGADGVLRVVRSENEPEAASMAREAPFFMDYRNADGSVAEMCGNGVRVFVRYLQHVGLAQNAVAVATRGGIRQAWLNADDTVTVQMGRPSILAITPSVAAYGWSVAQTAIALDLPNPHVVLDVGSAAAVAALDLSRPPVVDPPRPHGQNVEFIAQVGPRHLVMRVHERGVGETRSCGTGICAAVVVASRPAPAGAGSGPGGPDGALWRVDVPGGTCHVRWLPEGELLLTGPAVLVGAIELSEQWRAGLLEP